MSLAIICPHRDVRDWLSALHRQAPELVVEVWPEIKKPEQVEFALCWDHPPGLLSQFPRLKCISSLGAGVSHLLQDAGCPQEVPLVRVVDADLKQSMAEYVLHGILEHCRRFADYRSQQQAGQWREFHIPQGSEINVGIMGCGELGGYVAKKLAAFGFKVSAWSRTAKPLKDISVYAGDEQFPVFLAGAEILVCLLPLTVATENILNLETFSGLPQGAYLINVARGAHLVEEDLLVALDSGKLAGARLDVFREEPLPRQHPFWQHEKICLTPHIASITNPETAVPQVLENYYRSLAGEPLLNQVDRQRGY